MNDMNALKAHERFLAVLANTGNVTHACKIAKAGRTKVYARRKSDESFAQAWDGALELGLGALEDEAMSRAFDRDDKASHLLLMLMLKGLRPEKYRENPKSSSVAPKAEPLDMDLVAQILQTLPFESPRRMFQPIEAESQPTSDFRSRERLSDGLPHRLADIIETRPTGCDKWKRHRTNSDPEM